MKTDVSPDRECGGPQWGLRVTRAWPGDGEGRTAVLMLDFQVDFLHAAGRLPVAQYQVAGMLEAANRVIRAADSLGLEVVYIGNEFSAWDIPANWFRCNASVAGRPGARLDDRLVVINDRYFPKKRGDAFSNPRLGAFLQSRDVRHVVLAGVYANACVRCTARGALKRGYRVTVLRDAVAAASDAKREAALRKMQRQGVEVADSAAVLGSAPS